MRKLPYIVTVFDTDGEPTSERRLRSMCEARKYFDKVISSAACANVGVVKLFNIESRPGRFGRETYSWVKVDEWRAPEPEPEFRVEGYIVHSARALNDTTSCQPVNKIFHETEAEAEQQARRLADKWSLGHEGLIVFKAIKHVQKRPMKSTRTRIAVNDIE